jgi:hypothetical protein
MDEDFEPEAVCRCQLGAVGAGLERMAERSIIGGAGMRGNQLR